MVWLTDERRLALFLVRTIVRDPYHFKSLTRREQDLNLGRTWRLWWMKLCSNDNPYTIEPNRVSLRIQSKWGEIRTRKTPNADRFYTVLFVFCNSCNLSVAYRGPLVLPCLFSINSIQNSFLVRLYMSTLLMLPQGLIAF